MKLPNKQMIFWLLGKAKDHAPTLLTVGACAGTVATGVLAAKGTIKAADILRERKDCVDSDNSVPIRDYFDTSEIIHYTWKCYIPAALMGGATIACIVGANYLHIRKETALMAALTLSEKALDEYKEAVYEEYGESAPSIIEDKIHEKHVLENPPGLNVIDTGTGDTLFYEDASRQWFRASEQFVTECEYHFNRNFHLRGSCKLQEFYHFLGIEEPDFSRAMGWDSYVGEACYGFTWIDFSHTEKTLPDGTPYLHLWYPFEPISEQQLKEDLSSCGVTNTDRAGFGW